MADLYYIESDYFTPDAGYYVYTADAGSAVTSTATMTCNAGKLQSAAVTITSAFSPTLTVDVLKNHAAVLDAVSSLSVTASINRSTAVALSTIGDLNAMAAKTVDISKSLTSTATISAAPSKSVVSSTILNTTATLSCLALKLKITSANVSSTATFYAGRLIRAGRPRPYTQIGTPTLDTSSKKFGAASARLNYINHITVPASSDWSRIKTVDFWFNIPNPGEFDDLSGITNHSALAWYTDSNNNRSISFQSQNTGVKFGIISASYSAVIAGVNYYHNLDFGSGISYNTWRHFRLLDNGSAITIWIDGVKQNPVSVNYTSTGIGYNQTLRIGTNAFENTSTIRIDELLITKETLTSSGTSTFTIPSDRWYPIDQTNILLLSHFDSNYTDDIGEWMIPTLALLSNATITTQANANTKQATIALSSTASINAIAIKLQTAVSSLSSAASLTVLISKTLDASAGLSSTATVSPTVTRIKQFASTVDALFTPTISINAQLAGVALLESSFTQSTSAVKTTNVVSSQSAAASLAVTPTYTLGIASNLSSAFTQSTTAIRNRYADSAQTSAFTFTVDVNRIQAVSSSLTSAASISISADKLVGYASNMSASAAIVTNNDRLRNVSSTQSAAFALSTLIGSVKSAASAVTASANVSAVAVKNTNTTSTISSQFTQSTVAVKTVRAIPVLTSIATQLTAAYINATGTVLLESTASLSAVIGSIKQLDPELPYTGVGFAGDKWIYIQDTTDGNIQRTDRFLVSFWAHSPNGTVLQHSLGDYKDAGYIRFDINNGLVRFETPWADTSAQTDQRYVTWSGIDLHGWHQYMFYQLEDLTPNTTTETNLQLYVDGVLQSTPTVTTVNDGSSPSAPTNDELGLWQYRSPYGGRLYWAIGAMVNNWGLQNVPNNNDKSYGYTSMSGEITQFAAYWNANTPDVTNATVRAKLYNNGLVDLGALGTSSGLAQPNIYLRLEDYTDWSQRGSEVLAVANPLTPIVWKEYLETIDPPNDNNNWIITEDSAPTIANQYTPGMGARFSLDGYFIGTYLFAVSTQITATLTGTITKVVGGSSALNSTATITIAPIISAGLAANLTTTASIEITATNYVGVDASLSSSTTFQAVPGFYVNSVGSWTTAFTVDASVESRPPIRTEAYLTSAAALTCSASSFSDQTVLTVGQFTLVADVTVIAPIRTTANLTAITTLSATVGSVEQFAALVASAGTFTCSAVKKTGALAAWTSRFSYTLVDKKYTGIVANWTALYATITVGEVLNLDPYYTIKVIAESRIYIPEQETRTIIVTEETRVNIIEGYTQ